MNPVRAGYWISLLIILMFSGSVMARQASSVDMLTWPADTAELDERLQQRTVSLGIPAASVIIFSDTGALWSGRYGQAAEMEEEPLYAVGQLTETVTGLAVMQLVQRGELSLNSEVTELLPELQVDNSFSEPVRIIHLLEHTSGFDQRRFRSHYRHTDEAGHLQALNRDAGALQVRWQPGTMSSLSAINYAVLGAVLEQHYQQRWHELIEQVVLNPLGMLNTFSQPGEHDNLLIGHVGLPPEGEPMQDRWLRASEGLISTASDMASLGTALLRNEEAIGLSSDTFALMKRPESTLASDSGLGYGVGKGVDTRARFGYWYGKTASLAGFSATVRYAPQHQVGYVILSNSDTLLPALEEQVWQYLIRQQGGILSLPSGIAVEQRWQGWYRLQNPSQKLLAPLHQIFNLAYMTKEGADLDLDPWFSPVVPLRSLDGSRLAHRRDGSIVGVLFSGPAGELMLEVHGQIRTQISAVRALLPPFLVALAVVILLTHPFGRRSALHNTWVRSFTTLSTLCLLLFLFAAGNISVVQAATDNWRTVVLFLLSILFPLFALAGLTVTLYEWRNEPALIAKTRCLIGALAACGLALWFWSAGWVGLRLWAW